jgi:hypothetical protein
LNLLSEVSLDVVTYSTKHHSDEFLALVNELIVEVFTLNQEHTHTDLERHDSLDFVDSLLVFIDSIKEFITDVGLLVQEFLEALFLSDKESEFVIYVHDSLSDSQVLAEDHLDFNHGILDELIFSDNIPETSLLGVSETEIGSWDRIDFLDHLENDVDEVLLYLVDVNVE